MTSNNMSEVQRLTSPNPFALVTSRRGEQETNIMALSWWTYVSNTPATIAICISRKSYSGLLIKDSKEFCLCIPGENLAEAAFRCGTCSGKEVDKAEALGITLEPASSVTPCYVKESRVVLECRVCSIVPVGDHDLFIARVLAIHTNPEIRPLAAVDGYARLQPAEG